MVSTKHTDIFNIRALHTLNIAKGPGLPYCHWIVPRNNVTGSEWKQFCYNQADSKLWHWHRVQYPTVRPHNLDETSDKQMNDVVRDIKGFRIQYDFTAGTTTSNDMVCYEESLGREPSILLARRLKVAPSRHILMILAINQLNAQNLLL